jgi:hypothetical protein
MSKYGPTEAAKAAGGGVAAGGLAAGLGARYGSAGFSVGGMQAPVGGGGGGGAADPLVDAVFNAFKAEGGEDRRWLLHALFCLISGSLPFHPPPVCWPSLCRL